MDEGGTNEETLDTVHENESASEKKPTTRQGRGIRNMIAVDVIAWTLGTGGTGTKRQCRNAGVSTITLIASLSFNCHSL